MSKPNGNDSDKYAVIQYLNEEVVQDLLNKQTMIYNFLIILLPMLDYTK